ncbi:MAG: hypothetical protein R2860_12070 [Desulfobacterales bacterium]
MFLEKILTDVLPFSKLIDPGFNVKIFKALAQAAPGENGMPQLSLIDCRIQKGMVNDFFHVDAGWRTGQGFAFLWRK